MNCSLRNSYAVAQQHQPEVNAYNWKQIMKNSDTWQLYVKKKIGSESKQRSEKLAFGCELNKKYFWDWMSEERYVTLYYWRECYEFWGGVWK